MWPRAAFSIAFAWLVFAEGRVLLAPGLELGPLTSRFTHDAVILLAAGLCLAGARRAGEERPAWLLVGSGVLAWALGETYFTAVLWDAEEVPIPSPADAGFLGFLALAMPGIGLLVRERARHAPRTLLTDGLVAALAVSALSAALVVEAVLEHLPEEPVAIMMNLAYALGDLVLIGVLFGALAATGWRTDRRWLALTVGVAVFWLADSLYLVQTAEETYVSGNNWYEGGWWLGLLLIAAGAWQPREQRAPATEPEGMRFIAVPLAFGCVGLALLVWGCLVGLNPLAVPLAAASLVAVMARLVLTFRENTRMLDASRDEALTDALTGLANRRALMRALEARLPVASEARPLVLVLLDLDGFKAYNDAFGHPAGDALLVRLGRNLVAHVGERGSAFRLGGDEFCVLLEPDGEPVAALVSGAAGALSEHGDGFDVTCSDGAIMLPAEASSATDALRIADERLYAHKHRAPAPGAREEILRRLAERNAGESTRAPAPARRLGLATEAVRAAAAADVLTLGAEAVRAAAAADVLTPEAVRAARSAGERAPEAVRAARSAGELAAVAAAFEVLADGGAESHEAALAALRRDAGTRFDAAVVEAFCAAWEGLARAPGAA